MTQNNSGYPVYFGSVAGSPTSKCFSASTQTTAYQSSVSDTFVITGFKACA
ncbi:hypothetical protein [Pedococcus dokdonensis]|uniref:hypothetical protein n=1 Tax=Pedococcus dokdonensis TaxID=443156 RepID=UPI0012FE2123|nr:hypothetical protein [Pedococcus dokdonensis]